MAVGTTAMLALAAARGLSGAIGQRKQASSIERAGALEQQLANQNAGVAEHQATDALARGTQNANILRSETRGQIGSDRAAMAASGIDVSSGSAADVQANAARLGELDALQIENNAAREAWGYRVDATNARNQGTLAYASAHNQAASLREQSTSTLLTTAADMVDVYGNRVQKGTPRLAQTSIQRGARKGINVSRNAYPSDPTGNY